MCGAHVQAEAADIAARHAATHPDRDAMAGAACRYELSSDPDPAMAHFNDRVFISTAAQTLPGVHVFDPQAGAFH